MVRILGCLSAVVALGLAAVAFAPPARADHAPVYVVPSRPGIPVVINGRDVSYSVVEGDWGLSRPGHMPVTIIGGAPPRPSSAYSKRRSYHPRYGRAPERGRHEIEPPPDRALPEPPESFSRSWSTNNGTVAPQPVRNAPPPPQGDNAQGNDAPPFTPPGIDPVSPTINDPQAFTPPIIVVPQYRRP
jgi:hypothetical protein